MTRTRSEERLRALSDILCDGLMYSWFRVEELDADHCTAVLLVNTGDEEPDTGREVWRRVTVGPDDVARGLRMYREWLEGKRETYPGEWKARAEGNTFCRAEGERAPENHYGWQLVKFDRTNGREGDYDATTADCAMQLATLGYIIFG
ncbi:hypothetical protein [Mycolicibacterium phlei]|uniref:hypothetical protein n=1 Tax=Mycolicibacterium phlei TaxID=1771 RepID=UPI000306C7E6|nr:hypothetical protein [Mycolicibacterium phlei]MBF4194645.1 hypothetical protein [Mycolicibacterium phlei]